MPPNFSLNRFGDVKRDFILTTPHHFRSSMLKCLGKIALLTLVSTRLRNRICFAWSRKRGLKVISQGLAYECFEIHNAIFVPGFTCPSLHIRLSARYTSQQIKLLDPRLLPIIPAVVSTFMAQGHRVPAFNFAVISSSPFSIARLVFPLPRLSVILAYFETNFYKFRLILSYLRVFKKRFTICNVQWLTAALNKEDDVATLNSM